jgi:cyclophilin family peptidyl-prolyl cis-trans isomerase
MIQGGDPSGTGYGGKSLWFRPFPDEFTDALTHKRGMLSMANSGRNTNGSQFFIVTTDKEYITKLDRVHTLFGEVIEGMDTVDAIEASKTDRDDRPLQEVKIVKAIVRE